MENFSWEISKADRGIPWGIYTGIGVASLAIVSFFIYSGNIFGAALFILGPAVIIVSATQGQKEFHCKITNSEIKVNKKSYPFKKLEYYSIIADSLIVKPKEEKALYIPIHMEDDEQIHEMLFGKVEEGEYEEDFSQIINRFLRIH